MSEPIVHLLIKGEFRVWCLPRSPVGPLCVDQAMHIGFIGLFYWIFT